MKKRVRNSLGLQALVLGCLALTLRVSTPVLAATDEALPDSSVGVLQNVDLPRYFMFPNTKGISATYSKTGRIDLGNIFFREFGTNGRSCFHCHSPVEGWTAIPAVLQARFVTSNGTDAAFRANDGSTSPNADVSTLEARAEAYKMLLKKGVFRIGLPMPENAEFELTDVDDPYHYASAAQLSLFRRPLPATNLDFLSVVMWDGRESVIGSSVREDLGSQANGATLGHAQAEMPLTEEEKQTIVEFEAALVTAQVYDWKMGDLVAAGSSNSPIKLAQEPFYIGINDPFDPNVFTLFDAWEGLTGSRVNSQRAAVARGQKIFNAKQFAISGVAGLNDVSELGSAVIEGSCSTCHNAPNTGGHSTFALFDTGVADKVRRTMDLPLYTFRNKVTGEIVQTTDPGRALITGAWKDMSCFKVPVLRGVAGRAPFFHDGSAANLEAVVRYYEQRFNIDYTDQERKDLILFLRAL